MTVETLRRLETLLLEDDRRLDEADARSLVESTRDWGVTTDAERAELRAIVGRGGDRVVPAARAVIDAFLGVAASAPPGPVISAALGAQPGSLDDDAVFLGADGTVRGEAGVSSYTRGYDATQQGPLRFAHGSPAPRSGFLTDEENRRARERTPGQQLDAAARAFGAGARGFEALAHSKSFFDPDAEFWWGKCHAWAWAALSEEVNARVDVGGPEGERGLWIGGSWLSRADLGNWMMAVADQVSLADGNQLFDAELTAMDLLAGTTQFLMNEGGGVVADVFNDKKKGHKEVWNQPFVASEVTTQTLRGDAAAGLLARARRDGVGGATQVRRVQVVGTFAAEAGDAHEGPPRTSSRTWNVYAVTDASGRVRGAYMADDPALDGVRGLPTRTTDDLPEYLWKPRLQAVDDVLAGRRNWTVENDPHGPEFEFFVGTVLARGVPGHVRSDFEAAVASAPAGRLKPADAQALARRFPGVANAYAPEQWERLLGSRGLDARAFGAAWAR